MMGEEEVVEGEEGGKPVKEVGTGHRRQWRVVGRGVRRARRRRRRRVEGAP